MKNYDVLFMHDHFVLVTTVTMLPADDKRDIEKVAIKRLADEYGDEFAGVIKTAKQVSIEEVPGTSADEFNTVPPIGDMADAGEEPADE